MTAGLSDLLEHGTHACCRFDGAEQRRDVLSRFFAAGLARGERIAYFGSRSHRDVTDYLSPEVDGGKLREAGQLLVGFAEDAYLPDEVFDGCDQIGRFQELADQAVADGYAGLRVFADTGWLPPMLDDPVKWLDYELRVAQMMPSRPLVGFCGFEASDPSPLPYEVISAVHHQVLGSDRPTSFFVRGDGSGRMVLSGEIDAMCIANARLVLETCRGACDPLVLDLADLEFADGATAAMLHELTRMDVELRRVPPMVLKIWDLLGLADRSKLTP